MIDSIICGDCLEVMPTLEDKSVDMVLADLPYGVTACKWDTLIDLDALWVQWLRICKGAIVLTGTQPFTSKLVMSKPELFKYEWIWDKRNPSGFQLSKYRPLRRHENVLVFYNGQPKYYPIITVGNRKSEKTKRKKKERESNPIAHPTEGSYDRSTRYPTTIIEAYNNRAKTVHPTQKPVALFEYLIRTYTNEGDTVLDPTAGSGTTAIACRKSNRHYICIEKEPEYCAIAEKRIKEML